MLRNKTKPQREPRKGNDFGIFEFPDGINVEDNDNDSDGADSDLEAELAAITAGPSRPKRKAKAKIVPAAHLDALIAESLRDIPSDEDNDEEDDDDPELLEELSEIAGEAPEETDLSGADQNMIIVPTTENSVLNLLKTRIDMYNLAEANAKESGDSTRARRLNRGLKTLKDLLRQAEKGKTIDSKEIPPEVAIKSKSSAPAAATDSATEETSSVPVPLSVIEVSTPTTEESEKPEPKEDSRTMTMLKGRKTEFQSAALSAKRAGDNETAIKYIKVVKQFDKVMEALNNGLEVDLNNMPTLEKFKETKNDAPMTVLTTKENNEMQQESNDKEETVPLIEAKTVLEALEQRLLKYQEQEKAAKNEENSSKARRMGRICKQYQDAIKLHKQGKPILFDELPTPPGYAPIPGTVSKPSNAPDVPATSSIGKPGTEDTITKEAVAPEKPKSRASTSLMDKQIELLLERQGEFKQAAIEAKKANELEQAKEYLRIYKGLANLLDTARGGFPIDMNTIPIPPSKRSGLEDGFILVNAEDGTEGDLGDIRLRLEEQLCKQLMMCKNTRDHHKAMGDVAGTNRFENLALATQKDLDFIRISHKKGFPLPKFHYETKTFNIVKCNTDLSDNELEIHVIRGINYSVSNPKDIDTYVKVEFPWPQDDPFKSKTAVIRDTDNPEYNQKFAAELQRTSKACTRMFKRHAIKFEVYSKGGFLRSDVLIGTVNTKIQPLETTCEIHDSFSIMDGRKQTGGKLEVKVRVRNPIVTKQIEQINEKWVIIDY